MSSIARNGGFRNGLERTRACTKMTGLEALCEHSRRPVRYASQLPGQIERLIVETRRDKKRKAANKAVGTPSSQSAVLCMVFT